MKSPGRGGLCAMKQRSRTAGGGQKSEAQEKNEKAAHFLRCSHLPRPGSSGPHTSRLHLSYGGSVLGYQEGLTYNRKRRPRQSYDRPVHQTWRPASAWNRTASGKGNADPATSWVQTRRAKHLTASPTHGPLQSPQKRQDQQAATPVHIPARNT